LFWAVFGLGVVLNGLALFALGGYDDSAGNTVGKIAGLLMVVGFLGDLGVRRRRHQATSNAGKH
jgi:hypothetical protein